MFEDALRKMLKNPGSLRGNWLTCGLQHVLQTTIASDWLYVVPIDSHGHRPLNRIDGNDRAMGDVLRHNHAFPSVHRPTAPPDPPPRLEKRVRTPGRRLRQNLPNTCDLFVWNWQARTANAHKTVHALHLVHPRPVFRGQSAAEKNVTIEQWHFYFLLAIAPSMHFHRVGQERFHSLIAQSPLDRFFVARSSVQRVPAQLFLRYPLPQLAAHFVPQIGTAHSFALSGPLNW